MRVPRPLDVIEIRVLGCLLEKEQLTPDAYPLTLNQLLAACNQTSSREPVMNLSVSDVRQALERLREYTLVWRSTGARAERWEHCLDRRWELDGPRKAVMAVLLLRGAQTPGELRSRCERLYSFASPAAVEETLRGLATGEAPLVAELPREPGRRETRWTHLVGERPATPLVAPAAPRGPLPSLEARVAELERRVEALERELAQGRGFAAAADE